MCSEKMACMCHAFSWDPNAENLFEAVMGIKL